MPVYNSSRRLRQCLKSILNQTFKDFELICINDGSTDQSLEILNEQASNDSRIKIISQNNEGQGSARNNGFKLCKGETTIFLDSDDIFNSNFLEKIYLKYQETNADITICGYFVELSNGKIFKRPDRQKLKIINNLKIINRNTLPQYIFEISTSAAWNKLYKTEFLKNHNLKFDTIRDSEDIYFSLSSIYYANKIALIEEPLLKYKFCNETSSIKRIKPTTINLELFNIFKRLKNIIEEGDNKTFHLISLYNAYIRAVFFDLSFLKGELRKEFIKIIKKEVPLQHFKNFHNKKYYIKLLLLKIMPVI